MQGTACPIFTNFCAYYLRSWIDPPLAMLRHTSGYMDDVIFAHNGPHGGMAIDTAAASDALLRRRVQAITPLLRRIGCVVS